MILSCHSESLLIPPTTTMTGKSSAYAHVTAFRALSPPTL